MTTMILAVIAAVLLFGAAAVVSVVRGFLIALGIVSAAIALGLGVRALTGSDAAAFLVPSAALVALALWAKRPGTTTSTPVASAEWTPEEQLRLAQGTTLKDLQARSKRT